MFNFLLSLWAFFISCSFYALGNNNGTGARSIGLANTNVTLKDPFAFYNNIAGLSMDNGPAAFFSFELPFGMVSLKRISASVLYPVKKVTTGIGLSSFGNEHYHEFRAGVGIAHTIQNVSLGIKANYHETSISEIAVKRNIVLELGGITELTKRVKAGAYIHHWNKVFERRNNSALPVIMRAGISYKASKELLLAIESEKTSYDKNIFKAGIEYTIAEKLSLRTGINTGLFIPFFGVGIKNKQLHLDYAIKSHPYLGLSHSFSFILLLTKRK